MKWLMDDRAVVQRVLEHIERGTTDLSQELWREPVENYRSPERLKREIDLVLRRSLSPFCPSAALPQAGAYLVRVAAGTPLLAVRDREGTVRAFRNACRHRGMEIASGSGCAKAFVCRYHGWTYDLDGRLRHVPHEEGFPGLDRELHGLVSVTAVERHGLVFVTQDGTEASAESLDALPDLIAPDQQILSSRESTVAANWKIFLEGFLEGYHIRTTHPKSFYPYGFDNLTVVEHFGPNSRVTFPFQRLRKLAGLPAEDQRVEGKLTYVYQLFPNAIVAVLSRHTTLVILEPIAVDQTRSVTYTLTNRPSGDEDPVEAARRDTEFVSQTGAAEDQAVVCAIQRSIASGANEFFTHGRFEGAIAHFHRSLRAALG
jgi:phenylpropionate dioxygenase-like ring-hydroxylating dioxygenase large terminal subunit